MKLENKFYDQRELSQLLYEEKITALDYVTHQSEECTNEFKAYCSRIDVPENEDSAGDYLNFQLRKEEMSHTEGLD